MIFRHFLLNVNEGNAFVVGCEATHEALLVDVAVFDRRIEDFLEEHRLRLTTVFTTHDHFDHTGGLGELMSKLDVVAYSGSGQAGSCQTRTAHHGDVIRIGAIEAKVLATPGHTKDGVSLVLPGMVFTGDALFAGSVGGTSSEGAYRQQIDRIGEHIFSLPDEYEVHTGHGPSSTVGVERRYNPFFNPPRS